MLLIILVIGFLLLWLTLKIAKGIIKLVLIVILIILIASGAFVSHDAPPTEPTTTNL